MVYRFLEDDSGTHCVLTVLSIRNLFPEPEFRALGRSLRYSTPNRLKTSHRLIPNLSKLSDIGESDRKVVEQGENLQNLGPG